MTEEFERYRYEQARAWLEHVRGIGIEVERLQGLVESERAQLDGLKGIDYTVERVDGSREMPDLADLVDRIFDHIREYAASLSAYTDERRKAAMALEGLADPKERLALSMHYLMGETWAEVCSRMGYSKQRMMEIRREGVAHAYDVMPHSWRDPNHRAI